MHGTSDFDAVALSVAPDWNFYALPMVRCRTIIVTLDFDLFDEGMNLI